MLCGIVQNGQIIFLGAIDANYSKDAENKMSMEIYAVLYFRYNSCNDLTWTQEAVDQRTDVFILRIYNSI